MSKNDLEAIGLDIITNQTYKESQESLFNANKNPNQQMQI